MWKDYWHKCRLYAENEFETVKRRGLRGVRPTPKRIKHQTAVGKMGELIACDWLREGVQLHGSRLYDLLWEEKVLGERYAHLVKPRKVQGRL